MGSCVRAGNGGPGGRRLGGCGAPRRAGGGPGSRPPGLSRGSRRAGARRTRARGAVSGPGRPACASHCALAGIGEQEGRARGRCKLRGRTKPDGTVLVTAVAEIDRRVN